jgi:hypothetical protein
MSRRHKGVERKETGQRKINVDEDLEEKQEEVELNVVDRTKKDKNHNNGEKGKEEENIYEVMLSP